MSGADDTDLDRLAREWWAGGSTGQDAFERIVELEIADDWDAVAAFARAAIRTSPAPGQLSRLGTWFVEDLLGGDLFDRKPSKSEIAEFVRSIVSAPGQAREIIGGVWPTLCAELELDRHYRGLLTSADIAWLLDPEAPERRARL